MTSKTLTGGYSSGYLLKSNYSYVTVTNTGSVGGTGLELHTAGQSCVNSGVLSANASAKNDGVALDNDVGGIVTNNGSIYGYWGVKAAGDSINVFNNGTGVITGFINGINLEAGGSVSNYSTIDGDTGILVSGAGVNISGGAANVYNTGKILAGSFLSGGTGVSVAMAARTTPRR